jgi:hypothetical protein
LWCNGREQPATNITVRELKVEQKTKLEPAISSIKSSVHRDFGDWAFVKRQENIVFLPPLRQQQYRSPKQVHVERGIEGVRLSSISLDLICGSLGQLEEGLPELLS